MLLKSGVLSYLSECCKTKFNEKSFAIYGNSGQNENNASPKLQYISFLKNLSWGISNFCRYGGHNDQELKGLLQCLYHLLDHKEMFAKDDEDMHNQESFGGNIGWSFVYLTEKIDFDSNDDIHLINIMNQSNITKNLIKLLGSKNVYTVHSTLRAVGNILTGSDEYTQKCIEYGVLSYLHNLLKQFYSQNPNNAKLKEICWAISNITAGPRQHIIAVIESNFIPMLVQILKGLFVFYCFYVITKKQKK